MRVLVPLAEGAEEMEVVIVLDLLRRAGIEAVAAAVGDDKTVTAARGVRLVADALWSDLSPATFDLLAIPGGTGGTRRLQRDARVLQAVRDFVKAGKPVAALCAGPLVLQAAGVLDGKRATCHPGVRKELTAAGVSDDSVVEDGLIITSQGPGTAFAFALALIRRLLGEKAATTVANGLVLRH
ncbi:MAG: DJ-1/PfpI family protein [Kiritimatiellae bacterium]|nr:DJ-1/PfpI family protein [Kiritimatiellia bacterium]